MPWAPPVASAAGGEATEASAPGARTADVVAVLGGVAAAIGCLLPWIVADFGRIAILIRSPTRTISANAWSSDVYGKTAVIAAIALVVAAVLVAFGPARRRYAFGVVAVIGGAIVLSAAIFELLTKGARVDHLLRETFESSTGKAIADVEFVRLKDVLARLGFSVSLGVGVYLAGLGGIAGIVGGAMAARERRPRAAGGTGGFDVPAGPASPGDLLGPPEPGPSEPASQEPLPPPVPPSAADRPDGPSA
jgi:hypothetical protein